MRVCLYTSTALPNLGGQEIVVDALARHLCALGHEPTVLAPQPRLFFRTRERATCYPIARHARFWSMRRGVEAYHTALVQLHLRQRFDVIHCHGVYPSGYLAAVCHEQLGVPLVLTSHGGDVDATNGHLLEPRLVRRYQTALERTSAFVAISEHTRRGLRRLGAPESKIIDIPNGVDYAAYQTRVACPAPLAGLPDYVLFLGRLEERKGVHVLLQAWSRLPAESGLALLIAGDGSQRTRLEEQARSARLERVHFLGTCTGQFKKYLLQNAIVSVAPSIGWESFGLAVIEAQAAGCPVICSDLEGMRDLVQPRSTGWRVPPGNVESLHCALAEAIQHRAASRRMGQMAAQAARAHDWREIAKRHVALYRELHSASGRKVMPAVRAAA